MPKANSKTPEKLLAELIKGAKTVLDYIDKDMATGLHTGYEKIWGTRTAALRKAIENIENPE